MTQLTGTERAKYVQNMFTRIAKRYDLMNRLMTGGQDIRWRKCVIELARMNGRASFLDLGTGVSGQVSSVAGAISRSGWRYQVASQMSVLPQLPERFETK